MSEDGLRAQKKAATRQTLAEAGFQLAAEKGVEEVVVEDIVKRAGVSRRTFANYFSCKEEAIASVLNISAKSTQKLQHDPSLDGLTPLNTIEHSIRHQFSIDVLEKAHTLTLLSRDHPTLKLYVAGAIRDMQDYAVEGISETFGTAYSTEYYTILIGAVFGALMPVLDGSMPISLPSENHDESTAFDDYLNKIFLKLREGFK